MRGLRLERYVQVIVKETFVYEVLLDPIDVDQRRTIIEKIARRIIGNRATCITIYAHAYVCTITYAYTEERMHGHTRAHKGTCA